MSQTARRGVMAAVVLLGMAGSARPEDGGATSRYWQKAAGVFTVCSRCASPRESNGRCRRASAALGCLPRRHVDPEATVCVAHLERLVSDLGRFAETIQACQDRYGDPESLLVEACTRGLLDEPLPICAAAARSRYDLRAELRAIREGLSRWIQEEARVRTDLAARHGTRFAPLLGRDDARHAAEHGWVAGLDCEEQCARATAACTDAVGLANLLYLAYQVGAAYQATDGFGQAAADCTAAVSRPPVRPAHRVCLAAALAGQGNHDCALEQCGQAVRADPGYAFAYFVRGRIRADQGEYEEAVADFCTALRLDPGNARCYACRGEVERRTGALAAAHGDLDEAVRLDPNDPRAYVLRAWLHVQEQDYDTALADVNAAVLLRPRATYLYQLRADVHWYRGEGSHTLADVDRAVELDPERSDVRRQCGWYHAALGDDERALAEYTEALRLDPGLSRAYAERAAVYQRRGDWDRAVADCQEVVSLELGRREPEGAPALCRRANADAADGQVAIAIAEYSAALEQDPGCEAAYSRRAFLFEALGTYRRALADYAACLRLRPDNPDVLNRTAWLLATCSDNSCRDGRRAVTYARKACELLGWKDATALDTLAAACAECGQFAEAVRWQNKALALSRDIELLARQTRLERFQCGRPYHAGLCRAAARR